MCEEGQAVADDKTFTEAEHIAILADRVTKETAGLTAERDTLSTEKSELQNKLDVAESAKVAAEQRAEKAEADFTAFKAELDEYATKVAKKDERLEAVKEVAAHLGEDFLKDEPRIARIVAMDDESFAGYVADLKATVPAGSTVVPPPGREAAGLVGAGSTAAGASGDAAPSAARQVLLGRYTAPKGAE